MVHNTTECKLDTMLPIHQKVIATSWTCGQKRVICPLNATQQIQYIDIKLFSRLVIDMKLFSRITEITTELIQIAGFQNIRYLFSEAWEVA